jgi:hypothetical protein
LRVGFGATAAVTDGEKMGPAAPPGPSDAGDCTIPVFKACCCAVAKGLAVGGGMEIRMSGDSEGSVDLVGGDTSGGGAWSDSGASCELYSADESADRELCGLLDLGGCSLEGGLSLLGMTPPSAADSLSSTGRSLMSTSSFVGILEEDSSVLTFFRSSELIMGDVGRGSSDLDASTSILPASSTALARMLSCRSLFSMLFRAHLCKRRC